VLNALALGQPQFGHVESLELQIYRADVVAVGTLQSYELTDAARRIDRATFRVDEVLKGRPGSEIVFEGDGRTPHTFLDWIEGKSRAMLFVREGRTTVVPISGPLPQVMLADPKPLKDEAAILRAARRIAAQTAPEPLATVRFVLGRDIIAGWRDVGTITDLVIPVTEELHRWALRAARSGNDDERERAAEVLGHFGTPSDIDILKSMLTDKAVIYIGEPRGELGEERGMFRVRAAALEQLSRLGIQVEMPQIEFTSFEPQNVRYVYLERDPRAAETIRTLGQFKNLQTVMMSDSRSTDAEIKMVSQLASVTDLSAAGNPITDAALEHIARMPRLKVLSLSRTQVTDAALPALARLQSLEHLDLSNTLITNAGLVEIAKLKNLRSLNVANTRVTVEGLRALRELNHLGSVSDTVVDWQQTDAYYIALRDVGMLHTNGNARAGSDERATSAAEVKEFWSYGLRIGDAGLEALTEFRNLEELSISGSQVTEAGVRTILKFPRLKRLVINNNVLVTDAAMQTVAMVEGLTSLGIANTSVGDEGFRSIGRLSKLEWLAISGSKVTDAGFFHLRDLKNLQHLVMHNLPVGDEGIAHVASLPRLESVMLGNTQITDTGLMLLAKNPALKRISMNQAPNVTKEALAKLRRLRPDIELD
jgi:internalin A